MGTVRPVRQGTLRPRGWVRLLRPFFSVRLKEMSGDYRRAAAVLRQQLKALRCQLKTASDSEERWHIQRKIAELTPILTQMNELAELTEHYYERGYWRNEKYTL